jgi:hypothetical protein
MTNSCKQFIVVSNFLPLFKLCKILEQRYQYRHHVTKVTHMEWLFTDENVAMFVLVGGTFLFAAAGVLLGR